MTIPDRITLAAILVWLASATFVTAATSLEIFPAPLNWIAAIATIAFGFDLARLIWRNRVGISSN